MGERAVSTKAGLRREVDLGPLRAWVVRGAAWWVVGLGFVFRAAQYAANLPLWLDEGALAANILAPQRGGLLGPLLNSQLAPPGFLAVERLAHLALGESPRALRLFPFLCGVASLGLFLAVARRSLRPTAALIALAMFAVSDDLIAYGAELKQYETDVAAALACTWMGLATAAGPVTARRAGGLAAAGAVVVWFSHPSAFVLAGVGTVLITSALAGRRRREAVVLVLVALAWAASFAAVHAVAMNQLGPKRDMWVFWNFAFPPLPPTSPLDAFWPVRRLLYFFVNPLRFDSPLGPRLSAVIPLGFFAVGVASVWARDRVLLGLITAPVLFTLLAACLRLYPFHGRLVLFLVPSFLLLIAEGASRVGERFRSRPVWAAVLASLLLFPTLLALASLEIPRQRENFNPHGDRRPADLEPGRFPF